MPNKALSALKIVNADEGKVEALFSTFNVIDLDGDVTEPGAFEDGAPVRISAYNHASWGPGMLPVGKGTIRQSDAGAILDGQFFLGTDAGRDTFETVKQMADLQEWSYGFDILEAADGQQDGKNVQFLKKLKVYEVSPVMLGAGINTRTLSAKSGKQLSSNIAEQLDDAGSARYGAAQTYVYLRDFDLDEGYAVFCIYASDDTDRCVQVPFTRQDGNVILLPGETEVEPTVTYEPKGTAAEGAKEGEPEAAKTAGEGEASGEGAPRADMKLCDHLAAVKTAVDEVATRLADVMAMRADEGKGLGDESTERVGELADGLESAVKALREVVTSAADESRRLTLEDETRLAETYARLGLAL